MVASAATREAALGEAQAALQRRSAEREAEHGLRMARADAAVKRLQVGRTTSRCRAARVQQDPAAAVHVRQLGITARYKTIPTGMHTAGQCC